MEDIKPIVEDALLLALLGETFEEPVQDLSAVQGGLIAQTMSFGVGGAEYILRLTTDKMAGYRKEAFIYENFVSPAIPFAPIVKVGRMGELSYVISERMPGRELGTLSRDGYYETLPSNMQTLYAIHQVDVADWGGYGVFDVTGRGAVSSWRGFIAGVMAEQSLDSFYGKWHTLFETTFLERDFFERVYDHMMRLLEFCPEERYLVHGDYDYNNVLAEDGQVTAVLDWEHAKYGDFVYDIAYVGYWRQGSDLVEQFRRYYSGRGMKLTHYAERIACYTCYMGLDGMRFFAKSNNYEAYQATRGILQNIGGIG